MDTFSERLQHALQTENWPIAKSLLQQAAAEPTAQAAMYYNLGKVMEMNDEYISSGECFEKALDLKPDYALAWFELGRWALIHRHYDRALTAFEQSVSLTPEDADAWRNLARTALRCGNWTTAASAWQRFDDAEAEIARYRIQVETGHDGRQQLNLLLAEPHCRAAVLKAMTRTARGSIPLRISPFKPAGLDH